MSQIVAIVIDSSIYIDWLKRRENFIPLLMPFLSRNELLICGIIRFEVLRGIIHEGERARMDEMFSLALDIELSPAFWDRAWKLAWKLDRIGHVLPISDICIAQLALNRDATLVTTDTHFSRIPGLKCSTKLPRL